MAKSNRQFVFDGMELLKPALGPFVVRTLQSKLGNEWQTTVYGRFDNWHRGGDGKVSLDTQKLLQIMDRCWMDGFNRTLSKTHRSLVVELNEVRNKLAHDHKFTYDDTERALDSMRRLLEAVSAGEAAAAITKMRDTVLRTKYSEQARNEERKKAQPAPLALETAAGLRPWRDVVEPHEDVARGDFQQADFAADLSTVVRGEASADYGKATDFFARTYLTDGLSALIVGAAKRLSGQGGDPVVELQTNFGGGKTHSMLALYHLAGEDKPQDLSGIDQLFAQAQVSLPDRIARAVLVGTARDPANSEQIANGPLLRTLWGQIAWQLGGQAGYDLVAVNDEKGIAPGSDLLTTLFNRVGPCLILIDEWVAYLRQIYKVNDLKSGSFDANLTFVQSLTEAVKASPTALLVASLPVSEIEVGGEGGVEALQRLKQTFARLESAWRPASQEESYEIVRRRLFKPIPSDKQRHRDLTLRAFARLYGEAGDEFPRGCAESAYARKLERAYPIHPELFDQLYTSWGSLEKFQRTRGVLRLMAQVIHELWMHNDPSVAIMPGSVALAANRVESELQKYLEGSWQAIIASDIDGASATPHRIDAERPHLGKSSATRRVARAIFLGTAPLEKQDKKGLDDKHINLGVVQPGERPATFSDALRRLANQATFMHADAGKYWYSTSPSLNRQAADWAAQFDLSLVELEIDKALAAHIRGISSRGCFGAVQVAPASSADIPDEAGDIRAVVLGIAYPHRERDTTSNALVCATDMIQQRGQMPRVHRNRLIFLAPDAREINGLIETMRFKLAWDRVLTDRSLNLKQSETALAKQKVSEFTQAVTAKIVQAWCHALVPTQASPQDDMEIESEKFAPDADLFVQATKKLQSSDKVYGEIGPLNLMKYLNAWIFHDKPHLRLADVWDYLNRYTYLPRLSSAEVLKRTVHTAIGGPTPGQFAYAEAYDPAREAYVGLATHQAPAGTVVLDSSSLIVKAEVAAAQVPNPQPAPPTSQGAGNPPDPRPGPASPPPAEEPPTDPLPTRFSGSVKISPDRPAKDMGQIIEAIVEQLTTLPSADVTLRFEIDAEVPAGLDKSKVRTLIENANTLGFDDRKIS